MSAGEYTLWQHNPKDINWSIESYNNLYTITNEDEFWCIYNLLNTECLKYNMLFLMKKDIYPIWEHPCNKNGSTISLKIVYKDIYHSWIELSMALFGNYICKNPEENEIINGISISPKKGFCIIKIWLSKNIDRKIEYNNNIKNLDFKNAIYKQHYQSS